MKQILKYISVLSLLIVFTAPAYSQYSAQSYFMEDNWQSSMLNPALTPEHGYILLPIIGGTGVNIGSNSLSLDKLFYANPNGGGDLVPFYDVDINKGELINSLNKDNNINLDFATTIFGIGFYAGDIFWNFGVNLKAYSDVTVPLGAFELAALNRDDNIYSLGSLSTSISSYLEAYVGASMDINEKLSVGVRAKLLMGLCNAEMSYDYFDVTLDGSAWKISSSGMLNATASGLSLQSDISSFDLSGFEYDPEFKISGNGLAIDFGVNYELLDDLSLSFAVTDLGYIKWSGGETISAESSSNYTYSGYDISGDSSFEEQFDLDNLLKFESVEGKSYKSSLKTKINAAAEYRFLDDLMAAGALYTANFRGDYIKHEITAVASIRPVDCFTANLSYSFVANQIGAAVNLHTGWINLYVGADYIPTSLTPQYIPIKDKNFSFFAGIAIPLARR